MPHKRKWKFEILDDNLVLECYVNDDKQIEVTDISSEIPTDALKGILSHIDTLVRLMERYGIKSFEGNEI